MAASYKGPHSLSLSSYIFWLGSVVAWWSYKAVLQQTLWTQLWGYSITTHPNQRMKNILKARLCLTVPLYHDSITISIHNLNYQNQNKTNSSPIPGTLNALLPNPLNGTRHLRIISKKGKDLLPKFSAHVLLQPPKAPKVLAPHTTLPI